MFRSDELCLVVYSRHLENRSMYVYQLLVSIGYTDLSINSKKMENFEGLFIVVDLHLTGYDKILMQF